MPLRPFYILLAAFVILDAPAPALATVLSEPPCTVYARVVAADEKATLQVLESYCPFLLPDALVTVTGGSGAERLAPGDMLKTETRHGTAPTPGGTVAFIHMEPVARQKDGGAYAPLPGMFLQADLN